MANTLDLCEPVNFITNKPYRGDCPALMLFHSPAKEPMCDANCVFMDNNVPKEEHYFKKTKDDIIRERCNFWKVCG